MRIQVDRRVLKGFRQRALKKYPLEHLETIFGFVKSNVIHIVSFCPIDHDSKPDRCEYLVADIEEQRDKEDFPEYRKLQLLGTIHSHPDAPGEPSEADWQTSRIDGDLVSGIYQILPRKRGQRKYGKVKFFADPVQELEII